MDLPADTRPNDIAVIGMACRLPGSVSDPAALWALLSSGRDAVTEVPGDRWRVAEMYSPDLAAPGHISTRWAGCVDDLDQFDAGFFGISPTEAQHMDPQQRLLLEVGFEALEAAGLPLHKAELRRAGVFVGVSGSDYGRLLAADVDRLDAYFSTGQAASITANRISYAFDLHGPSIAVDTACSSALVAVHLAVRSLRAGECDVALVGGVNLVLAPDMWVSLSKFGMMSPRGRCRPFGADADGYVRSDGCAVLVLKPLRRARREGDEILAVIRGSAVNQDGRSNGLTAPNGTAQEEVIRQALRDAGTDSGEIGYVEAHGTGTPLGDPIEFGALAHMYGAARGAAEPCWVGSIKSNIGHTEAAAGIVGLSKVILSLQHGQIPASLYADPPNPRLPRIPGLRVAASGQPWPAPEGRRVGAVSSYGFGGTNAHVVVAGPPPVVSSPAADAPAPRAVRPALLPLSARSPGALRELAAGYIALLDTGQVDLDDLCHTSAVHRSHHDLRVATTGIDRAAVSAGLREYVDAPPSERPAPWRDVVWVFAGQGREFAGMGGPLLIEPVFAAHAARCDEAFRGRLGVSVLDLLRDDRQTELLERTDVAQAVLFSLQSGLAAVWREFGTAPAAVVGHSAGEAAAAYAAGLLDFDSAVDLVVTRGTAMQEASGSGRMAVAQCTPAAAAQALAQAGGAVTVAVENGPASIVLSGPDAEMSAVLDELRHDGLTVALLPGGFAFHSSAMVPAARLFSRRLAEHTAHEPHTPVFSSITGQSVEPAEVDAEHWADGIRGVVRFREAIEELSRTGFGCFLEIGARPTLAGAIRASAEAAGGHADVRFAFGADGLRPVLARVYASGAELEWSAISRAGRYLPDAPRYPWQHQRYWALPDTRRSAPQAEQQPERSGPVTTDVRTTIAANLAALLGSVAGDIPDRVAFLELGADSVMLLRLVTTLNEQYGTAVKATELFDRYPTVADLATAIASLAVKGTQVAVPVADAITPTAAGVPVGQLEAVVSAQLDLMREQLRLLAAPGAAQPVVVLDPVTPIPAVEPVAPAAIVHPTSTRPLDPAVAAIPGPAVSAGSDVEVLTPSQRRYVDELAATLARRSPTSKRLAGAHRGRLAESRPWANFRPAVKELVVPITARRSAGSRIWDVDGTEYTDFCLGFGVHLFGHSPAFVIDAVQQQLGRGFALGPQVEATYVVAEQLCRITGHERVTFCNTGTEAVLGAVRLARLATGRAKVAYFTRSYHGLTDLVLGQAGERFGAAEPVAPGVSARAIDDAIVLPYDSPASLAYLAAHAHELAAVLVEPVQNRHPAAQPAAFLAELRQFTERYGVVLIFDEMITGFRIGLRGAQGYFGIRPDLTTYGKIIGGGLPLAAIAGRSALLDGMDGGTWGYGDDSAPDSPVTLFGGTFQKHPLAMAAAGAVLNHLEEHADRLYPELNARAERITTRLTALIGREGLPYEVASFGSLWRLQYRGVPNLYQPMELEMLYYSLLTEGLYVWEGRTFFLSTAHTDADGEQLIDAAERSIGRLREAGFLPAGGAPAGSAAHATSPAVIASGTGVTTVPATLQQQRMWELCRRLGAGAAAYHETVLLELRGPLDRRLLEAAVNVVRARHPALRAACADNGRRLLVQPPHDEPLPVVDVATSSAGAATGDRTQAAIRERAEAPFDLERGPLFRPALLATGDRHTLMLNAHHVVVDGQSFAVILDDLATAYRQLHDGQQPSRAEVTWPVEGAAELADDVTAHWRSRLSTFPTPLSWRDRADASPEDRPVTHDGQRPGARWTMPLPPGVWPEVVKRARSMRCTPFMLLFSAFTFVLHGMHNRADIVVGTSVDRRDSGATACVGHFVNIVPVRSQLATGTTFPDYLHLMRTVLVEDLSRADLPLADLDLLRGTTDVESRLEDLVSVVFDLNPALNPGSWPGLDANVSVPATGPAKHDLFFDVIPTGDSVLVDVTYREPVSELFVKELCTAWVERALGSADQEAMT